MHSQGTDIAVGNRLPTGLQILVQVITWKLNAYITLLQDLGLLPVMTNELQGKQINGVRDRLGMELVL